MARSSAAGPPSRRVSWPIEAGLIFTDPDPDGFGVDDGHGVGDADADLVLAAVLWFAVRLLAVSPAVLPVVLACVLVVFACELVVPGLGLTCDPSDGLVPELSLGVGVGVGEVDGEVSVGVGVDDGGGDVGGEVGGGAGELTMVWRGAGLLDVHADELVAALVGLPVLADWLAPCWV